MIKNNYFSIKHFATAFPKTWKMKNILQQRFQRLGKRKTFCDSVSKDLESKKHFATAFPKTWKMQNILRQRF